MAPASLNHRRPPPYAVNQPNRRRTPSPTSRRYVPPDRYMSPRGIVFTRDDYPNVYRPNIYRPDDTRSPSPGDRFGPPRNSDPIKASPMKGPVRRPGRPATPPRDVDRNRARPRRQDLMLASRMSDHPQTHPLPDRPRGDSWVDAPRTSPERPFRKFGGDSYRPADRLAYDSYRPSYDSRYYTPKEPLSPLNGTSRSRYDRRRSRSDSHSRSRSRSPSPRSRHYRPTSISSSRSRSRSRSRGRSRSRSQSRSRSRSRTRRSRSYSRARLRTRSRSRSRTRSRSRRRGRSKSRSRTRSRSRRSAQPHFGHRNVSRSLSRSSIASSRISVQELPKTPPLQPPPVLNDDDAVPIKPPELVQEMIHLVQQVVTSVPPPPVVEKPSPEQTTVRLPAFDHPLYEEQSTHPKRVRPSPTAVQEIEKPQPAVAQEPSGVAMSVDAYEIPVTVSEEPPATEIQLDAEKLMSQKEAALLTPNETAVAPSKESLELVKDLQDDTTVTSEQEVVVGEKEVGSEPTPFSAVLSPPAVAENPEEIEVTEKIGPVVSGEPVSVPPPTSEQSPVEESTRMQPVGPTAPSTEEEAIGDQITAQDIPSLTEAKSSSEALRIVVMTRLLCDHQTREERVNPVLLANQSIFRPVKTTKSTSVEELISEVCDGQRRQDRMSSFVGVKRVLEKQFTERDVARLAKVRRLRKEYLALHERWVQHCAVLDEQSRSLVSETETIQPAGRTTRRSAATLGDAVRSDLEMEQIIASLGNDEATDPAHLSLRNLATIPDMISVTHGKVDYVYDDTNHRVESPAEYYGPHTGTHDWTEEEKKIFLDKFAEYPKQFGIIASFLPNKTQAQCVAFYYLHKKIMIDFRKVVSQYAPNKRRRRGTGRKKGIIADIQQHDAEVSGGRGRGVDLLTVPSRVSKGKKAAAQAEGGRRANNSRRAVVQQEGTPGSTPTPEPESSTSASMGAMATTTATTGRSNNRRRRGQTQPVQNGTKDGEEDAADVDPRPTKRAKRSRKTIKSASTVVEDSPTIPESNSSVSTPVLAFASDVEGAKDIGPVLTATTHSRRRSNGPSAAQWTETDKNLFLSLLAQHGDDFKRIAASMPNKTTVQVGQFYKSNLVDLDLERVAGSARKWLMPPPGFQRRRSLDDDKNADMKEAPTTALAENQRPMYAIPSEGWLKHADRWQLPDDPELLRCSPVTWKNVIPPPRELLASRQATTVASVDGEYVPLRLNDTLDSSISSRWQNFREVPTSDIRSQTSSARIQSDDLTMEDIILEKRHAIEEVKKRKSSFGSVTMAMVVDRQPSPPPPPPSPSVISARRRLLSVAALTGADEPVYPVLNSPASAASTTVPPSRFYS